MKDTVDLNCQRWWESLAFGEGELEYCQITITECLPCTKRGMRALLK